MNALSNLIPFRVAQKGAAAPSPVTLETMMSTSVSAERAAPVERVPSAPHVSPDTPSLTGLIRRRETKRPDLSREQADHAAAVALMAKRAALKMAPMVAPPVLNLKNTGFAKKQRRQLTVRLDMDTFEKLDQLAKQTGRTYQDIQADAIRAYLER
jgi:uncharacterized protein (DUF4415 family)